MLFYDLVYKLLDVDLGVLPGIVMTDRWPVVSIITIVIKTLRNQLNFNNLIDESYIIIAITNYMNFKIRMLMK